MLLFLLLAILCYFLAGFANGVMDTLVFHYSTSKFSNLDPLYWNPSLSWRNKYKDQDPAKGPKFWGSTTFLVWVTDGWHLAKMLYLAFQRTSIVLVLVSFISWQWWLYLIVWMGISLVQSAGFHLSYSKILPLNEPE